eukprot:TRINITY_DN723_c0_g2_i1.p1 TRINITY_DN723_c0_g2~~TRINITY_DN723_c0_g2_i1.p1  ORF type:complete len:476 (+),score=131.98 TRINITY_DN723_c0_g2_i1:195-1622(+)
MDGDPKSRAKAPSIGAATAPPPMLKARSFVVPGAYGSPPSYSSLMANAPPAYASLPAQVLPNGPPPPLPIAGGVRRPSSAEASPQDTPRSMSPVMAGAYADADRITSTMTGLNSPAPNKPLPVPPVPSNRLAFVDTARSAPSSGAAPAGSDLDLSDPERIPSEPNSFTEAASDSDRSPRSWANSSAPAPGHLPPSSPPSHLPLSASVDLGSVAYASGAPMTRVASIGAEHVAQRLMTRPGSAGAMPPPPPLFRAASASAMLSKREQGAFVGLARAESTSSSPKQPSAFRPTAPLSPPHPTHPTHPTGLRRLPAFSTPAELSYPLESSIDLPSRAADSSAGPQDGTDTADAESVGIDLLPTKRTQSLLPTPVKKLSFSSLPPKLLDVDAKPEPRVPSPRLPSAVRRTDSLEDTSGSESPLVYKSDFHRAASGSTDDQADSDSGSFLVSLRASQQCKLTAFRAVRVCPVGDLDAREG